MIDAKTRMELIRSYPSEFLLWEYDRLVQKMELFWDLEDENWDLNALMQDLNYMRAEIVYRLNQGEGGAV